jgi:hypothetical protein
LIGIVDAREIAAMPAILLHDTQGIPLLDGALDTQHVREEVYEIFNNAVADLERVTDSFRVRELDYF